MALFARLVVLFIKRDMQMNKRKIRKNFTCKTSALIGQLFYFLTVSYPLKSRLSYMFFLMYDVFFRLAGNVAVKTRGEFIQRIRTLGS